MDTICSLLATKVSKFMKSSEELLRTIKEQNLTITQAAAKAHVSRRTLVRFLRGHTKGLPNSSTLQRLVAQFGKDWLIGAKVDKRLIDYDSYPLSTDESHQEKHVSTLNHQFRLSLKNEEPYPLPYDDWCDFKCTDSCMFCGSTFISSTHYKSRHLSESFIKDSNGKNMRSISVDSNFKSEYFDLKLQFCRRCERKVYIEMFLAEDFVFLIKQLKHQLKLTNEALADNIGVSSSTLNKILTRHESIRFIKKSSAIKVFKLFVANIAENRRAAIDFVNFQSDGVELVQILLRSSRAEIEEYVYSLAIEQLSDISLVDENYCPFSHMILHSFRVGNVNISRSKITVEYTFKYTNRLYLESLNAFVSNQIHDYSKKGEIGAELICIGDIDVESDKFSVISFRKKQVLL